MRRWATAKAAALGAAAGLWLAGGAAAADDAPPIRWDPGGVRTDLARAGVRTNFLYDGDLLADVAGGESTGGAFSGRLALLVNADLGRAGWPGAKLHFGINQIHGPGLTASHVGNLMTVSSIEAPSETRLFTFWVEQQWSKSSLRAGKITALEFVASDTAALFVNSTFGWPTLLAEDLPGGGPSYPLGTPGLRLKWTPNRAVLVQGAVFNGDPTDSDDAHGFDWFDLATPPLVMGEAWWAWGGKARPGVLKLGAWRHQGEFAPVGPAPPGGPAELDGDWGATLVVEQTLVAAGGPGGGLNFFARAATAPDDRNLIDLYADAGLVWSGPVAGRPDDLAGLAVAYARVSPGARPPGTRDHEVVVEITYQTPLTPAVTLQPDLQLVLNPGAGAPDPGDPGRSIPNAVVVGVRTLLTF